VAECDSGIECSLRIRLFVIDTRWKIIGKKIVAGRISLTSRPINLKNFEMVAVSSVPG
jgi:hypothetical protein